MCNALKIIRPDGKEEEINRKLSLEEMQAIVGGYIEIIKANIPHRSLVVNEEGLLLDLPRNETAYKLLHPAFDWKGQEGYESFCLHGTVILIKSQ